MTHIQSYLLKSAHFLKFNGSLENRKNLHLCVSFLWLQSAAKHITITGADVNKSLYDPEVVSALCHLTAVLRLKSQKTVKQDELIDSIPLPTPSAPDLLNFSCLDQKWFGTRIRISGLLRIRIRVSAGSLTNRRQSFKSCEKRPVSV